jgi:glycosyltransferase involved in cell wall biosynthesis
MRSGNNGKKNLFIVVPSIRIGGTEKVVSYLCKNIDLIKFEVNLIVLDKIYIDLDFPNINIFQFNKRTVIASIPKLISFIRNETSNALFLSFFDHLNIVLCILKYFKVVKIKKLILRSSTILSKYYKYDRKIFSFLLAKIFYKKCDLLICQSNEMSLDFINTFDVNKEKIRIIYNPIMVTDFKSENIKSDEISIFNSSNIKYLAVGNIRKEKGYFRMIDSFELVRKNLNEAKLFIIGDGPLFNDLKAYIKLKNLHSSIFLLGKIDNPNYFFANSNALLFTSYFEGYPNTLIEANFFKLPIVAYNDCSVIKEIIIPDENGFIVDSHSINDFVNYSINSLNHKFLDSTFSLICDRHNPKVFLDKMQTLLLNE